MDTRTGSHRRRGCGVRIAAAVLMAVWAAGACAPSRAVPVSFDRPPALAVVTWNMHVGAGNLRRLLDDLTAGRLTGGVPPAEYTLLLQEAIAGLPTDPAAIARERQLAFVYEPVRERNGRTTGNAIVSTRPLTDTREIELPRERERRTAVVCRIVVDGADLFLANAHLENRVSLWRGLLFSDEPRGRQARMLIASLPAGHGIAGGDLNTWLGADEPALKAFAARFPDTPDGRPAPTVRDRLVLDHLFFDLPEGWTVQRRVLPNDYGSDHRPVIGTICVG